MNNERIDLTQFEGYIEKLGLREGHHLHIVEEPNRAIGPWNKWEGGLVFDLGETSAHGIYSIPTARLMVAAPRLLAELKRCYEHERALLNEFQKMSAQIDGLRGILSLLEDRHDIDMSQFKNYFASE